MDALPGNGIIYTLTVRDAGQVTMWLRSRGVDVEAYTGETGDRRPELEQALLENRVKALVATTALGMGFDNPDLGFVIHYHTPGSIVAYYQQVGRAGRALDAAYGVLLSGDEETDITDYFIESAFPTRKEVKAVLDTLDQSPEGLSVPQLLGEVNISKGRVDKAVLLLSLESPAPIAKQGTKWQLTAAELSDAFWERAHRLTDLRRAEQAQMQRYVSLSSGHMEFLIEALAGELGKSSAPELLPLPTTPDPALVQSDWLPTPDVPAHRAPQAVAAWGDAVVRCLRPNRFRSPGGARHGAERLGRFWLGEFGATREVHAVPRAEFPGRIDCPTALTRPIKDCIKST